MSIYHAIGVKKIIKYVKHAILNVCLLLLLLLLLVVVVVVFYISIIMCQRTTKPTIRLVRPAKTQISLRIRAVWSESSLIACAFFRLQAIQRGINENHCHTGWIYRLIWVFAGYTVPILLYFHFLWDHWVHCCKIGAPYFVFLSELSLSLELFPF